jgi:hypothetical protein
MRAGDLWENTMNQQMNLEDFKKINVLRIKN